jgi:hypothetical protein
MYVSAERLAIADREVMETFEQTSIAWQAIPHWDTGNPGQHQVNNDIVNGPGFLNLALDDEAFNATLAQLGSPTPDALLAEVMAKSADLAASVDATVLNALASSSPSVPLTSTTTLDLMNFLIDARAKVEDAGYRAPSCLITNTDGLKALNAFTLGSYPVLDYILSAANINSLHRATQLAVLKPTAPNKGKDLHKVRMILVGRRQRIAHGAAADASPGEEPVDLAVSVLPRLEVVGENASGSIRMSVQIRSVTRIKDTAGVVVLLEP